MAGLLQVVYESEEVVFRQAEGIGRALGDTEEFDGIVVEASFHDMVAGGADLDTTLGAFELLRSVGIGQCIRGKAQQDELRGIIAIAVEGCLEPGVGAVLQVSRQKPVAHPVEKQDR